MYFQTLNSNGACSVAFMTNLGGLTADNSYDDDLSYNEFIECAYKVLDRDEWMITSNDYDYELSEFSFVVAYTYCADQYQAQDNLDKFGFTSSEPSVATKNLGSGAMFKLHYMPVSEFIAKLKSEYKRLHGDA